MPEIPPPPPDRKTRPDTAWKVLLAGLLICQFLAWGAFLANFFWEREVALVSDTWLGLLSLVGILLWCVESVHVRPDLTRFALRCILVFFLAWVATFFLMPFKDTSKRQKKLRDEATLHFRELVEEGKLPPPFPKDDFEASGSRHGGLRFRYKDAGGDNHIYFARRTSEWVWIFENPLERKRVKVRTGD